MLKMSADEIAQAIGEAFVEVIRGSCEKYIGYYNTTDKVWKHMEAALSSLQKGKIPNYDNRALPFFYASWYHLSHVRMCYSIFKKLKDEFDLDLQNQNTVTDIGCGTYATLWGLIYFSAYHKALEEWEQSPDFIVHLFDASEPMLKIGQSMYEDLRKYAEKHKDKNSAIVALHDAIEAIRVSESKKNIHDLTQLGGGGARIITGIHVLYEQSDEFHNEIIDHMRKEKYDYAVFSHDAFITGPRQKITNNFIEKRLPREGWREEGYFSASWPNYPKWERDLIKPLIKLRQAVKKKYEKPSELSGEQSYILAQLWNGVPAVSPEYAGYHLFQRNSD